MVQDILLNLVSLVTAGGARIDEGIQWALYELETVMRVYKSPTLQSELVYKLMYNNAIYYQ